MRVALQSIDSDGLGARPLLRSTFQPSDDVAYREASFARSQDSITQPVSYSKLAGQSMTGRGPVQKSRLAPESSAGLSSMAISCSNSCLAKESVVCVIHTCCCCTAYLASLLIRTSGWLQHHFLWSQCIKILQPHSFRWRAIGYSWLMSIR